MHPRSNIIDKKKKKTQLFYPCANKKNVVTNKMEIFLIGENLSFVMQALNLAPRKVFKILA